MMLTEEQQQRYKRNIMLDDMGKHGQEILLQSSVLVIGAGGLGSPVILYLAAAGVGHIGICDFDKVDISNLQRQIIHTTADIGREKTISAQESVKLLNPDVEVILHQEKINAENIQTTIKDYDFIIDATDNFASKFLINDACVSMQKPYSHGGINGFNGQVTTVIPKSPCYRCIYGDDFAEEVKEINGVLGAVAAVIGSIQATEAIKYLLDAGGLLSGRLLIYNALKMEFKELRIRHDDDCSVCSDIK
ncbi:MAG: HesA/MoeB/ThiF family protein [Gammaproteobacteria bacterium]|nr:MAG: HesA/MoeB/ThiF family protein [Gammaproteobacteria bacterium]